MVRCDKADDVMPYWSDSNCRTYFVCRKNVPYLHTCPVGTAFSAELNECVQWEQVRCSAQNKALWLAMEASALIRESSLPASTFGRDRARGEVGGGPKQMIDTRGLARQLRDPGLERVKRLHGLLSNPASRSPQVADVSAYSGPVIPVRLPGQVCSARNTAQTSALLNAILQAETGCSGKPEDCRLPYLEVRCESDVGADSVGVNRGHMGHRHHDHTSSHKDDNAAVHEDEVVNGAGDAHFDKASQDTDEKHWETEEETVVSRENIESKKRDGAENDHDMPGSGDTDQIGRTLEEVDNTRGDSAKGSFTEEKEAHAGQENVNLSQHKNEDTSSEDDAQGNDMSENHSGNTRVDNDFLATNNDEGLKESKTRFSVWSSDYANGYEIEDTNTEIHFPEFGYDKRSKSDLPSDQASEAIDNIEQGDGRLKSGDGEGVDNTPSHPSKTQANIDAQQTNVFADSDLFALREHIERKIRESLKERFGNE
ncbi:hypothetical protein ElyMa_001685900 [Elysia marginata]|uniref:Chitin-binding type-2 domain-containing protein n=1 Tax=Elysia marginata TaxID=1093978 RepID=A0AAV4JTG0_9GAST|nr:hypothetical protein ElyMa_001685900 [Elysia marginata]